MAISSLEQQIFEIERELGRLAYSASDSAHARITFLQERHAQLLHRLDAYKHDATAQIFPVQQQRKPSMNYSTAIFLASKNVRAINCLYLPKYLADGKTLTPDNKPKMFKSFDKALKAGDVVLVPTSTRLNMTTATVDAVDVEVSMELHESSTQIGWIIGTIPPELLAGYQKVLKLEADTVVVIKHAEKARKEKELRDKILEANPDLAKLGEIDDAILLEHKPEQTA